MLAEKDTNSAKPKKLADPNAANIDPASQEMIQRAHDLGVPAARQTSEIDRALECRFG